MNTFKLYLENFQSISNGYLEFEVGQNFIIGQSNSGKTATFRAIKACLLNPKGSQRFIKHGTKQATVTIEYEGNTITWVRTAKESSYTINGEEYVKTGSSNALKILEDTGFAYALNRLMNMESELELPFPFDLTESELFKLFENVFCISDSAVILKSAKENEEVTKKEVESLNSEEEKNKKKLEELENFKKEVDLNKLDEYKKFLVKNRDRVNLLKKDLPSIKIACELSKHDLNIKDFKLVDLKVNYEDLLHLRKLVDTIQKLLKLSKEIPDTSQVNTSSVLDVYGALILHRKLLTIGEIPVKSFDNLLHRYNELKELSKSVETLKKLHGIKFRAGLEKSNIMQRYKELKDIKEFITSTNKSIESLESKLVISNKNIEEVEKKLKEYKVCPLCHSRLDG